MHCRHCEERHMEDLRLCAGAGRRVRGNTPEGAVFFTPNPLRLVFFGLFLRGLLGAGTFVVRWTDLLEEHSTGGRKAPNTGTKRGVD